MAVTLLGAMFLVLLFLQFRGAGVVHVGPDEWLFSRSSRLLPLAGAEFNSYLYLWVYRSSSFCGPGFMECVRLINGVFLVAIMPFVYMTCRRVAGAKLSLFVAILIAIGPSSAYATRFMPEAMYHFGFWVLAWFCLGKVSNAVRYGLGVGVIIGLLGLVKMHALFLLPAVVAFILLDGWLVRAERPARDWLLAIVAMLVAAGLVRFALGYIFAGPSGLSLLGEFYGGLAQARKVDGIELMGKVLVSLKGHAMALALLFAVPVAALLCPVAARGELNDSLRRMKVFTLLCLGCMVMVTAVFTARQAGYGEQETIGRLHMRYYAFVLPLLVMIAASHVQLGRMHARKTCYLLAALVAVLIAMAMLGLRADYEPALTDNPHLFGIVGSEMTFWTVAVLSSLSLLAWAASPPAGAGMFLFIVVPLVTLLAGWRTAEVFGRYQAVTPPMAAAVMARLHLREADVPVLVVAPSQFWGYQAMFYLDNPLVQSVTVPGSESVSDQVVPPGVEWILAIGGQRLPWYAVPVIESHAATLARVGNRTSATHRGEIELDFREHAWPGVVAIGLSRAEKWGAWSNATRVQFKFDQPLPQSFTLVLKGQAIDNIDKPFTITAGEQSVQATLHRSRVLELDFSTEGSVRSLVFDIPWATTLAERGIESNDRRRLGIGFVSLRIVDNTRPQSDR